MYREIKASLTLLILMPFFAIGQETGIKFETGISWSEILAKAKSENKFIFMDCYTTWCIPCKQMEKNIYRLKGVGDYFNSHFINVAVQMDRTAHDSSRIRDWYSEIDRLHQLYTINAYPTYLFFSPDGTIVHRMVGATQNPSRFISEAGKALDANTQYYTLVKNWKNHLKDSVFLLRTLVAAEGADEDSIVARVGAAYYQSLVHPELTIVNIRAIRPLIKSLADKEFQFFLGNAHQIDQVMGDENYVEGILAGIVFEEKIKPMLMDKSKIISWMDLSTHLKATYPNLGDAFFKSIHTNFILNIQHEVNASLYQIDAPLADWEQISENLKKRYPGFDCTTILINLKKRYYPLRVNLEMKIAIEAVGNLVPDWSSIEKKLKVKYPDFNTEPGFLKNKARFYAAKNKWSECEEALLPLFRKYGDHFHEYYISEHDGNDMVWYYIFMHSENKDLLHEGTRYIYSLVNKKNIAEIDEEQVDTYANMLYKTGKPREAMDWENKALEIGSKNKSSEWFSDSTTFRETLEKMQKGEKTWEE